MPTRLQQGFRLGGYEVKPLEGRLIGPEGEEHVQPKGMEVLVCLATYAGEVIARQDILEQVWGGIEHDDALTRTVSELRRHLDDHPDTPQYIQTIPKRGYRLVAEIELLDDTEKEASKEPQAPVRPATTFVEDLKRRRVVRVALAYALVAWLIIQVAETTLPALGLPAWTVTFVIVLAIFGLPIAVSLSWAFQVTEEGVVFDRTPTHKGRRYAFVGGTALLLVASGILMLEKLPIEPAAVHCKQRNGRR